MKRNILILSILLITIAVMGNVFCVSANSSYYIYDVYGGSYYDAEKSPSTSDDDSMCWAASASNILAYTGWGSAYSSNADDIFSYYRSHWSNAGGSPYFAWEWWFSGTNSSQGYSGWSQVEVAGGGFWSGYSLSDSFLGTSTDEAALWAIQYLLTNGYGVSLGVVSDSSGHAITCWGYQYDDSGNIVGIYVTDSDDSKTSTEAADILAYYDVIYRDGKWYLQDFYGYDTWYITEVLGLKICTASVPESATIILLGLGLIALGTLARKRKSDR